MSNQPKICPTCHTSNPESAQFCAACGSALQTHTASNMMQKYPQYKLQPTSIYKWKYDTGYKILLIFIIPVVLFILYSFISLGAYNILVGYQPDTYKFCDPLQIFKDFNSYTEYLSRARRDYYMSIFTCLLIASAILTVLLSFFINSRKKEKLSKAKSLSSLADYIQEYKYGGTKKHPKYVFFVKDNKFGVMNVTEFKVAIPAQYDEIAWREPNRILTVTKGNETYDIDIFGNQLR